MNMPGKDFIRLRKNVIPGFIRKNLGRKLVALLLAILIYGVIKEKYFSEERSFNVPVDIVLPVGVYSDVDEVPTVTVVLCGGASALSRISVGEIKVRAIVKDEDLTGVSPVHLTLRKSWIGVPAGVRLDRVTPSVIELEHLKRREVQTDKSGDVDGL